MPNAAYLSHVDRANSQSLVAQNRSVLVPFPPLQHDLKLVAFPLQEVRVLKLETQRKRLLHPLTLSPSCLVHGSVPFLGLTPGLLEVPTWTKPQRTALRYPKEASSLTGALSSGLSFPQPSTSCGPDPPWGSSEATSHPKSSLGKALPEPQGHPRDRGRAQGALHLQEQFKPRGAEELFGL